MSFSHATSFDPDADWWDVGSLLMGQVNNNPEGMHVHLNMAKTCQSHVNIIGGSGFGKSSLSELMIRQVWDRPLGSFLPGGLLVDPHGDLTQSLLLYAHENAGRLHPDLEIVYLEPSGPLSFYLDPFDPSYYQDIPAYDRPAWVESRAGVVALAMARAEGAADFREMQRLGQWLTFFFAVAGTPIDERGTHLPLGQINVLYQRHHKRHRDVWNTIYPHLSDDLAAEVDYFHSLKGNALKDEITSTTRRLKQITSAPVAPIFSAEGTTLNLKDCITSGKWVLLNLKRQGVFREHHADLVGRIVLSMFVETIVSLNEEERRHFFLWVDEALRFAGPDMITILKECRKFQATGVYCLQDLAGLELANTDIARQLVNNAQTTLCFGLKAEEDQKALRSTLALPNINFTHKQTIRNVSLNEHELVTLVEEIDGVDYQTQEGVEEGQEVAQRTTRTEEQRVTDRTATERRQITERSQAIEHSASQEHSTAHERSTVHEQSYIESSRRGIEHASSRQLETRTAWERFSERSSDRVSEQTLTDRHDQSLESVGALRIGSRDTYEQRRTNATSREATDSKSKGSKTSISSTNATDDQSQQREIESHISGQGSQDQRQKSFDIVRRRTDQDTTTDEQTREKSLRVGSRESDEQSASHADDLIREITARRGELSSRSAAASQRQTQGERTGDRSSESSAASRALQDRQYVEDALEKRESTREGDSTTHGERETFAIRQSEAMSVGDQHATIQGHDVSTASTRSQAEILSSHQRYVTSQGRTVHTGVHRKQQMIGMQRLIVEDGGLVEDTVEQYTKGDQVLRMLDTAQIMLAHRNTPTVVLQVHEVQPPFAGEHPHILAKIKERCKQIGSTLDFVFRRSEFLKDKHPLERWFSRLKGRPHSPAPSVEEPPTTEELPDGF